MPDQAADLIVELALLGPACGGLSVAGEGALAARLPAYGQWRRDLDSAGIPDTLQHDDLHSNNICVAESAPDRASEPAAGRRRTTTAARSRIIDWADASIGHPFGTMLATLRSIARHGRCEVHDPRVLRVRDACLEPFTTHTPRSELIAVVNLAQRVGAVTRALSWRAALLGTPKPAHGEYDFPVRGWMRELLAAGPRTPDVR